MIGEFLNVCNVSALNCASFFRLFLQIFIRVPCLISNIVLQKVTADSPPIKIFSCIFIILLGSGTLQFSIILFPICLLVFRLHISMVILQDQCTRASTSREKAFSKVRRINLQGCPDVHIDWVTHVHSKN